MGRSKPEPSFFMSAGARLMVMLGGGNIVAAIFQRGADAVAAFAHRSIGQSDGVKVVSSVLMPETVDFNLNEVGVDSINRGAESLIEHEWRAQTDLILEVTPNATRIRRLIAHLLLTVRACRKTWVTAVTRTG